MKEFEDCIEYLEEKRDSLEVERKDAEERNEDYEKQKKAKDEADYKRLIAKITRDKNQDVKDIIHNEEIQTEANQDFTQKLQEEKEKLDHFLDDIVELEEKMRLALLEDKINNEKIEVQKKETKELKDVIDTKQIEVNKKVKKVDEDRKVSNYEMEKFRKYSKANAALKAKLEFIESKYDYTSSAKNMSLDDFKELMSSNANVNNTMGGFTSKLEAV